VALTPHARFTDRRIGDLGSGASDAELDERRRRIHPSPWTWLRQVHGAHVVVADRPGQHAGAEGDAIVTVTAGVPISVRTADCAPILLVGDGSIAVVHAGWQGLVAGVIEAVDRRPRRGSARASVPAATSSAPTTWRRSPPGTGRRSSPPRRGAHRPWTWVRALVPRSSASVSTCSTTASAPPAVPRTGRIAPGRIRSGRRSWPGWTTTPRPPTGSRGCRVRADPTTRVGPVWWRKAMHMLGLEEEVDGSEATGGYGRELERGPVRERAALSQQNSTISTVSPVTSSFPPDEPSGLGAVRPIRSGGSPRSEDLPPSSVGQPSGAVRRVVKPVPMAANAKPHVVRPESFNQAQNVADAYKINQPVIMDLQDADRELFRRLIDFASGLCYGLGGQMERLDTQVYLLTPTNVTVSDEERRRLRGRGYDA
jgi:cell division inhibitor SepF